MLHPRTVTALPEQVARCCYRDVGLVAGSRREYSVLYYAVRLPLWGVGLCPYSVHRDKRGGWLKHCARDVGPVSIARAIHGSTTSTAAAAAPPVLSQVGIRVDSGVLAPLHLLCVVVASTRVALAHGAPAARCARVASSGSTPLRITCHDGNTSQGPCAAAQRSPRGCFAY